MGRNRKGKKRMYSSEVISVRLPTDLLKWVDRQVALFVEEHPGVYYTRNAYIRMLLHRTMQDTQADQGA